MASVRPPQSSMTTVDPARRAASSLYGQPHQLEAWGTDFERYLRFGRRVLGFSLTWMGAALLLNVLFGLSGALSFVLLSLLVSPVVAGSTTLKYLYDRQRLKNLHPMSAADRRARLKAYKTWRRGAGRRYTSLFSQPEEGGAAYAQEKLRLDPAVGSGDETDPT